MPTFSIEQSLQFGSTTFKKRPWLFFAFILILFVITGIGEGIQSFFTEQGALMQALAIAIGTAFSILSGFFQTRFFLRAHDSVETVQINDAFRSESLGNFSILNLFLFLGAIVGFMLLIIPGIVFCVRALFSTFILIDKKCTPMEALKESFRITKGHGVKLFLLSVAFIIINLLGILAFIIGIFVTLPITLIALVHTYREISASSPATE
jgi:uncharacterized membrane protein